MASDKYIKGVRTRYRNYLEKEMRTCLEILDRGLLMTTEEEINLCIKRLKTYVEKVETQCEKCIASMKDDEGDEIDKIMDEDYSLCDKANGYCQELEELHVALVHHITSTAEKEQTNVLQKQMQDFISEQTAQQKKLVESHDYWQQKMFRQQMDQHTETINKLSKPSERVPSVKLPKLDLKCFSGDRMKWYEFWDTFECTVHSNSKLTNIEKFSYLQSKLVGEAKNAISGLSLCNDNYKVAIELLKERFGRKQDIIDIHYREMMTIDPPNNKTESLRRFLDVMEKHLRSLEVMGENINQHMFISMIKSKLPQDVLLQMEVQKGTSTEWTVDRLRERLRAYIVAREHTEQESKQEQKKPWSQKPSNSAGYRHDITLKPQFRQFQYNTRPKQPISTESLVSGEKITNAYADKYKCRYCANRHWSDECTKHKTIAERKKILKDSCYKCLKTGHRSNECRANKLCVHCGERNKHHRSLCPKALRETVEPSKHESAIISEEVQRTNVDNEENQEGILVTSGERVLMQTAQTEAKHPSKDTTKSVRLLLDSGSQRTYVTERLAEQLGLERNGVQEIKIVTFGSNKPKIIKTPFTKLDIVLKNGKSLTISANIVPDITGTIERKAISITDSKELQDILTTVTMADTIPTVSEYSTVDVLIGNDFYLDIVLPQRIEVQPGLYLLSSKLGWMLTGRTSDDNENQQKEMEMLIMSQSSDVDECGFITSVDDAMPRKPDLEDFWAIESIGIKDDPTANEDDEVMSKFKDTLQYMHGRYYARWPWKEETPELPVNRGLALGRLRSTMNRLSEKPELMNQYDSIIKEQLSKGVIEKVNSETTNSSGVLHYLPHHAVLKPQKTTTKVRLVYDASAKTKGDNKSLNECLYRGPVMLHNLCGILMRFRTHNIAVVADIEKAFLQVGLQEDQRDATRFLWIKDHENPTTGVDNVEEYRFCRVPFGVISSPFILGATIEHHLESYQTHLAEQMKNDIYVDNLITGTSNESEAVSLYTTSKKMFKEAAMNLREWSTNSDLVRKVIPEEDKATTEDIGILGHLWSTKQDTLSIKQSISDTVKETPTKRKVLKQIASVYDPLGLVSPILVQGKAMLQTLWSKHLDWDDTLDDEDIALWTSIRRDLGNISQITVPRNIAMKSTTPVKFRLACFCDASKIAYSAAVYLHQESEDTSKCDLIFSKSRLAPTKSLTIPRLELMAVLIGTRITTFVRKELGISLEETVVWTDSQCVLHWIASENVSSVFVRNRVREIKQCEVKEFLYVPSAENPADLASRGVSVDQLRDSNLWWNGPAWLSQKRIAWKVSNIDMKLQKEEMQFVPEEIVETMAEDHESPETVINNKTAPFEIKIENYSTVSKLLRVTAYCLRFIRNVRRKNIKNKTLSKEEIDEAEVMWTKYVQKKHFENDGSDNGKQSNLRRQLGVFVDENGLLRCRGRIGNADISEGAKTPILLPKNDRFTDLMVEKMHKAILHSGVSQTLSHLRSRFWVPSGRATVKRVLQRCLVCRRHEGGAYKMPNMSSFPKGRVTIATPFSKIGLDYLGPLYVKTAGDTNKVWICLFTCLITRAVHLEMVQNLSTEEFLMALRRFVAIRGSPEEIISDNAQQFKLANETLKMVWQRIIQCEEVQNYSSDHGIKWKFIVEYAPWMGGFYERLVGLVKRSLRKTIGRKILTTIQMQTFLKETESMLNTRPLVYVGDDINSTITLTPAHFLSLNPKLGLSSMDDDDDEDYLPHKSSANTLLKMWKKGQKLLNQFWKVWQNEYLLSLRERFQSKLKSGRVQSRFEPNVGDVVIIKEDIPRSCWKFGKITHLVKSTDGQIRSAKVKLSSGRIVGRPLNLLFPIEISE